MPELTWANSIAGLVFSGAGFVAFIYGKRMQCWIPMFCGIGLMMLPLFVDDLPFVLSSLALTGVAVIFRNN